ncbi:MAG TPA: MMPL family transporter, partial [Gemmatimonadales bacterium]|nr:MMPL family transporter [Gemmatimonadales bacterium]
NVGGATRQVTESSQAEDLLRERFSRSLSDLFAVTFTAPDPIDQPFPRLVLDSLIAALSREPYVHGVAYYHPGEDTTYLSPGGHTTLRATHDSSFISRDRRTTFVLLALTGVSGDSSSRLVMPVRRAITATLDRFAVDTKRYQVRVTGRSPLDFDIRNITAADSKRGELRLLPITMGILLLAFGALVAALLPLLVGFMAIWTTLAIITVLAQYTPMSVFVLNMTSMLGLGVGIDYSLLIVTRFREELNKGLRRRDAAHRALVTAGSAVFTSGLTVVVGFGALLLTPLTDTRSVGIGGLVVVGMAVLLSTTLLPALLAVLGRQIDRPRWLARRLTWYHAPGVWEKWARSLGRHPRRALLLGGLAIGLLTAPVAWIRIGLPARHWWPTQTEAGQGVADLEQMGAGGVIIPIRLVLEFPAGQTAVSAASLRGLQRLSDSLRGDTRIAQVRSLVDVKPGTSLLSYSLLYSDLASAREQMPDFLDAYLSPDARVTLMDIQVRDTTSMTTTMEITRDVRRIAAGRSRALKDAKVFVGGYTAAALDVQDLLIAQFPLLVTLILAVTGVMLAVAFRSVLVPIKAVIMNTLSVAATFGLIVLVFQMGYGSEFLGLAGPSAAIFVVVPVLVFAVVFGLSMDYEVFLLSRVKEAFDRTGDNDRATQEGLSATATTITSAALIMILVFGVFAFARVLAMQFLGFGLAVAVLLDATLIRMVLVPAIMHLAGRWNWWPGVRRPIIPARRDSTSVTPN